MSCSRPCARHAVTTGYLFAILSVYIAVLACLGMMAGEKKSRPLLLLVRETAQLSATRHR